LIFYSNVDNQNKNNSDETMSIFFDNIQENRQKVYSEIMEPNNSEHKDKVKL